MDRRYKPLAVRHPTRRETLALIAGAAALAGFAPAASADAALLARAIRERIGARTPLPGRITLELPRLAENGNIVPIAIEVESPMTREDHVRAVHLLADGNPNPEVASFYFTPAAGRVRVATRMRLAQTQNVLALAEMSDGRVFAHTVEVAVALGGCSN